MPHLVVRILAFVALTLAILGDLLNLLGISMRNLTIIVFWQLSFMLYFILAYITLIASYITSVQMMLQSKQPGYPAIKGFVMSLSTNLHFVAGIYIFYFCVKRSFWTDAYKLILRDEEEDNKITRLNESPNISTIRPNNGFA